MREPLFSGESGRVGDERQPGVQALRPPSPTPRRKVEKVQGLPGRDRWDAAAQKPFVAAAGPLGEGTNFQAFPGRTLGGPILRGHWVCRGLFWILGRTTFSSDQVMMAFNQAIHLPEPA